MRNEQEFAQTSITAESFCERLKTGEWSVWGGETCKLHDLLRKAVLRVGIESDRIRMFIANVGTVYEFECELVDRFVSAHPYLLQVWREQPHNEQKKGGNFHTISRPRMMISFVNLEMKRQTRDASRKSIVIPAISDRGTQQTMDTYQRTTMPCIPDDLIITSCPTRGEILIAVRHLIEGNEPPMLRFTTKDGKVHQHVLDGVRAEHFRKGSIALYLKGTDGAVINFETQSGEFFED